MPMVTILFLASTVKMCIRLKSRLLVHSNCSNFLLSLASHGYSANVMCQNENTLFFFKNSIALGSELLSRYVLTYRNTSVQGLK